MALSPSAAWYEACTRADADLRFLVAITDGVTTWTFVDASMDPGSDLVGTEVGIQEVAVVSMKVNPIKRSLEMSELFVNFNDPSLRPIIVANRIEKQMLTVHLGAASLDEADFIDLFSGPIDTITPVSGDDPKIVVTVLNSIEVLVERRITGYWIGKHPLEILYTGDGKGVLEKAGTFTYNAATFDPSDAAHADIPHIMFSRVTAGRSESDLESNLPGGTIMDSGIDEPTPALDFVNTISEIIGGNLVPSEAGVLSFVRFNAGAAAVDTWTDGDVIPGTLVQEPLGQNIINRIHVEFAHTGLAWVTDTSRSYIVDDSDSQTLYGIREHKIVTPWINPAVGWLTDPLLLPAVTFDIQGGNMHALSGNRTDAWAQISAALPLYLLLQVYDDQTINEILKAETLTRDASSYAVIDIVVPGIPGTPASEASVIFTGCRALIDDVTRGVLGTDDSGHTVLSFITDITSIVLQTDALLARFKYGCDVFTVDTLLTKYDVQISDLISPIFTNYLAYGKNGLDGTEKYEIISKEIDVYADPPVIHWKLMSANTDALTGTAMGGWLGLVDLGSIANNSLAQQYASEAGVVVADAGGLTVDISAGILTDGQKTFSKPALAGHALPASKDCYIKTDKRARLIVVDPVANDAAAPSQHPFEENLSVVVTAAAAITSIDNTVRNTEPLQGALIVDDTVGINKLNKQQEFGAALNANPTLGMYSKG